MAAAPISPPKPLTLSPGIITSNYTTNGEHKFQLSFSAGVSSTTYGVTTHGYRETSGIMNLSNQTKSGGYDYQSTYSNVTEGEYHNGTVKTKDISLSFHGQYKIADLANGGEFLFNSGVTDRISSSTLHTLDAKNPFGNKEITNQAWGQRSTDLDGNQVYKIQQTTNTLNYNTDFLSTSDPQQVTTNKHTVNYYATLNFAQDIGNGRSFNVGLGAEGFQKEVRPLITANFAQETNNGIRFEGGVNYTFTGGHKVDQQKLHGGIIKNAQTNHEFFDTAGRWADYDKNISPYESKTYNGVDKPIPNHGLMLPLNNPASDQIKSDLSPAFNKASLGKFGAHFSVTSPEIHLGNGNNTLQIFGRIDANLADKFVKKSYDTDMNKENVKDFYKLDGKESIQHNFNSTETGSKGTNVQIGIKLNIGGFNPDAGTKCPTR